MITPDASRLRERLRRPGRDQAGDHPQDVAGRDDPRVERAGDGAADRGDRRDRARDRGRCFWSTRPSRPASCRSIFKLRRSTCWLSRATRRSTGRPAPVRSTSGPRTDGKLRPWREGGTGGDSSSPTQPIRTPVFARRGHAQRAGRGRTGRRDRLGRRARAGEPATARGRAAAASRRLGSRFRRLDRSPAAGTPRPTSEHSR